VQQDRSLCGVDWLDFAAKATGAVAQAPFGTPHTDPAAQAAAAKAAADKARVDADTSNTKWYVLGGLAALGVVGVILARVLK
jgi:hypothetical protein